MDDDAIKKMQETLAQMNRLVNETREALKRIQIPLSLQQIAHDLDADCECTTCREVQKIVASHE